HVVKQVASRNLDVRKLVYIYLLRYAAQEPDLALLSVNTFQRDLGDVNQFIRAMALRVMTGIRVPAIAPLLVMGVRKCATDASPYVRKTAALALSKCYTLDPTCKADLVDILVQLLHDRSAFVIGSVLVAFQELCPERLDLLHRHFRRLCHMLVDADEWGQVAILEVLARYGRTQFLDPKDSVTLAPAPLNTEDPEAFYASDEATGEHANTGDLSDRPVALDPDHALLLQSVVPLLQHRNNGVVMAAIALLAHLGTSDDIAKVARPLGRLLSGSREVQYTMLKNIAAVTKRWPALFADNTHPFFVRGTDPVVIARLKLRILTDIVLDDTAPVIAQELHAYVKYPRTELAVLAVQATGRFVAQQPRFADACLRRMMRLTQEEDDTLAGEATAVVRQILVRPTGGIPTLFYAQCTVQLIATLPQIRSANARASIVWLVTHYSVPADSSRPASATTAYVSSYAPDVLRQMANTFADEADQVKLQALRLGLVLALTRSSELVICRLFLYLLDLARYDRSYDVRDCARWIRALAATHGITKSAATSESIPDTVVAADAQSTASATPRQDAERFTLGSLALLLNQMTTGYEPLPDWPAVQPDPSVRDVPVSACTVNAPIDSKLIASNNL
ncbi:Clathrin/coatomer adaptor, adaptin-like protein, partial [Thamnocephalis sphaerospora]